MILLFKLISKKRDLRESELGNVCSQLPLVFIVSDAARESCIFIVVRVGSQRLVFRDIPKFPEEEYTRAAD